MTELVGNNSSHGLTDESRLISLEDRPTQIDSANAMARSTEIALNIFNGTDHEREELRDKIVPELNNMTRLREQLISVTGKAIHYVTDPTTLDARGHADVHPREVTLYDQNLLSLGYFGMKKPEELGEGMVMRHMAVSELQQVSSPEIKGIVFKRDVYEIPIDGSTRVKLVGERMPPHIELLHYTVPDLIDDVDIALDREGSLTNKLRALEQINLADHDILYGKVGEVLRSELLYYINQRLAKELGPPYHVTGRDIKFVIPSLRLAAMAEWIDIVSRIDGVCLSLLDNTKWGLATQQYVENVGWQSVIYELNPDTGVYPEQIHYVQNQS